MYDEILVPTDGTKRMAKVVDTALDLAEQNGARLHALHVVDVEWADLLDEGPIRERLFERGAEATDEVVERADHRGLPSEGAVEVGVPHVVIVDYAREHDVDLIVLGNDEPHTLAERVAESMLEAMLGGTTDRVVKNAPASVMTVRI